MESKLESILNSYHEAQDRDLLPVQVSRHGPFTHNGYTWSITFPDGTFQAPSMTASNLVYSNYSNPEKFASIQLESLKYANVQIEKVPQPILQGYHLTLEVEETTDESGNVWREVQWCTAVATEGATHPEHFYESYTVQRSSGSSCHPGLYLLCTLVFALAAVQSLILQ